MNKTSEVLTLAEQMEEEFLRLYEKYNVKESQPRRQADMLDAIWSEVYELVFKPDSETARINNQKSKLLTYKVYDVEAVVNKYISLNRLYGGVLKINIFQELTGIHRSTFNLWNQSNTTDGYIFNLKQNEVDRENNNIIYINTSEDIKYKGNCRYNDNDRLSSLRFDVIKKIREAAQGMNKNARSQDTIGNIQLSNEDEELGYNYGDKNRAAQFNVLSRALSATELPQLGVNMSAQDGKRADLYIESKRDDV